MFFVKRCQQARNLLAGIDTVMMSHVIIKGVVDEEEGRGGVVGRDGEGLLVLVVRRRIITEIMGNKVIVWTGDLVTELWELLRAKDNKLLVSGFLEMRVWVMVQNIHSLCGVLKTGLYHIAEFLGVYDLLYFRK